MPVKGKREGLAGRVMRRGGWMPFLLFVLVPVAGAAVVQSHLSNHWNPLGSTKLAQNLHAPRASKFDRDHDGLRNRYERRHSQTSPRNRDSDGDGFSDGFEIHVLHTNPLRPNGIGVVPAAPVVTGPSSPGGVKLPPLSAPSSPGASGGPEREIPSPEPVPPVEEPTPPVEEPTPPVEEPTPPVEEPTPPVEEPTPPVEEPVPPVEEPTPPVEEPTPPVEEPTPPVEEPTPPVEEPTPPATADGEVATAADLLATAGSSNSDGKTFYMRGGNYGNVNLSNVRRGSLVTFVAYPGETPSFSALTFGHSQDLRFDGFKARTVSIEQGSSSAPNRQLQFANCTLGGTASERINPLAVVGILAYSEDILFDGCSIGWTRMNGAEDNGNGIRAVNGDAGPIARLTIRNSRIHHTSCDAIQVAGVSDFTLDRTEIGYVAPEPGYTCHADSLQNLGFSGDGARITNNYIHHIGYYTEGETPDAGAPAGQLIYHNNGGGALIENNLFVDSRNYALNLGSGCGGCPSSLRNVILRRNTIIRGGTAFGGESSPDMRWAPAGGTGNRFERNVIGSIAADGSLSSSVVAFSGNVFTDQSPIGSGDVGPIKLSFDANMNCTSAACKEAGYRKPSGVSW